ncbi:MAG: aminopeptidase [Lutisporaceae bacterium]
MVDLRVSNLAKLIVNYSLDLNKGDIFLISGNTIAEPLIKEVYKEALIKGAYPILKTEIDGMEELFYKYGNDEQMQFVNPATILLMNTIDAYLSIRCQGNSRSLTNIDSHKKQIRGKAMKTVQKTYLDRLSNYSLKWCGTIFPSNAAAMDADMSLTEYEDMFFNACFVSQNDYIKKWKHMHEKQNKLIDYLSQKSNITIQSEDTHLSLSVKGRKWINCDGKLNLPDGEIFTSPIENSLNGHIKFSFPAVFMGREVSDVDITFENGKVIKCKANKGQDYLEAMLDIDDGARYAGEFAIATNYNINKFTKNISFDEKIGGTIHIALGSSLPMCGGKIISSIHWDMVCDMKKGGELYADDELFYKNGKFII